MGPLGIDFAGHYAPQREKGGNEQQGGDDENGACRKEVAARAHRAGGKAAADGLKARVSSEPFADGGVPHKPKADGGDGRSEDAARRSVKNGGRKHHQKNRKRCVGESRDGNRCDREAGHQPLRAHGVHQRAAWHLSRQADETGHRQNQTDIDLGPFLSGQIDGDEGTESGLNVGDAEDEPVEPAQTSLRWGGRWLVGLRPSRYDGKSPALFLGLAPRDIGRRFQRTRRGFCRQPTSPISFH
jgi:hypothetical protein